MSEMIDRVARAIYEGVLELEMADEIAKAAIEAMREPSEGMLEAGFDARDIHFEHPKEIWRAMIDAALKED